MLLRFLIDKTQVEAYRDTDPFNGCQTVPGIMSMHIISAGDDGVKLWKNVSFFQKTHEIQYFTEKKTISGAKYWVLKENDLDSREKCKQEICRCTR